MKPRHLDGGYEFITVCSRLDRLIISFKTSCSEFGKTVVELINKKVSLLILFLFKLSI